MGIYRNKFSKRNVYNTVYSNMRGVDFSGDGSTVSANRWSYSENMYRDYEGGGDGITESVPGFRRLYSFGGKINGIFSYNDKERGETILVHSAKSLYRFPLSERDKLDTVEMLCSMQNRKSISFRFGSSTFILDGNSMIRMSADGKLSAVSENDLMPYIPTTFINGEEYEQINLLTSAFKEVYTVGAAENLAYATPELLYTITDSYGLECEVRGVSSSNVSEIYVPKRVLIGDNYYTVTAIADYAFRNNTKISSVFMAGGVRRIGTFAFGGCTSLSSVTLCESVAHIGNAAFDSCSALVSIHLGRGLESFGSSVFSQCFNLSIITYSGTAADFEKVQDSYVLGEKTVSYNIPKPQLTIQIPINTPTRSISRVLMGTAPQAFKVIKDGELIKYVTVLLGNRAFAEGKEFTTEGLLSDVKEDYGGYGGFLSTELAKACEPFNIINKSTVAECFDGRVFLSGIEQAPGVCFYSGTDKNGENNPLYFGAFNYFLDGGGTYPVTAMTGTASGLVVFLSDDDGSGSIYYHVGRDTGIDILPRIYPVSYIHSGIGVKGDAVSFFDDTLFVTDSGICALDKEQINLERSIAIRSHNVNPKLLSENLSQLSFAIWRGYLVVAAAERFYLADSRSTFTHSTGNKEYEWYFLNGIGTYTSDERVYRYSSSRTEPGYYIHSTPDEIAEGTVMSEHGNLSMVYFVNDGDKKYEVYPTEQRRGGRFNPATKISVVDDLLFFGTVNGDLCVFNSDKRGTPPDQLAASPDFDADDYKEKYGRIIHPTFYSFANHAPTYALRTKLDNGSIPHLIKDTVKHSLSLKCRAFCSGQIICEVSTDKDGYSEVCRFPGGAISFADIDFSSLSLSTDASFTVPLSEKEKGWIEKQISLYTNDYNSPFGIYTIAYRFTVRGKIKKNR